MTLNRAKWWHYGLILKPLCCNSPKSATIEKSVFQIGLRLPNGAF